MSEIFNLALIYSTMRLSTPLVLAALGGLYSERSGVINIALEGLMLAGAFTAAAMTHRTGNPWVGLLAAIAAGVLVAGIHAVACIKYKADQVVSGTAINILMLGVPALLSGAFFQSTGATPQIPRENLLPYAPIIIAAVLVAVTWYVLNKTPFGLRLRAVGENPEAADTAGISVTRIRYIGVLLSGALAAIGGAYLSIGQASLFTRNMTAGRGFIALAALIFGKWRPVQTLLACLLFGFAEAVAIQLQGVGIPIFGVVRKIPVHFIQMFPYVLTMVVLAGFIGLSRAPRALGLPYQKEK
jgi:simple sugar transport system permease protein